MRHRHGNNQACELFAHTVLAMNQIAEANGPRSDAILRRRFGSIMNTSPTSYLTAFQERKAVSTTDRLSDAVAGRSRVR